MDSTSELDIINHLLEIEKGASSLITEAQVEADKRVAEAKAKYNSEYKAKYDAAVVELEASYKSKLEEIKQAHEAEVQEFKTQLESGKKNTAEFNKLLDKLLFN